MTNTAQFPTNDRPWRLSFVQRGSHRGRSIRRRRRCTIDNPIDNLSTARRVEHLGRVAAIVALDSTASGGNGFSMTIEDSAPILGDCHIGDSICVNGACLTVTEFGETWFKVGLAPETLERTDLGERKVGDLVNLERAMAAHVRFGGHFVQGHVDSTVTVLSRVPDGNSLRLTFQLPPPTPDRPSLLPYLIAKGYITLDGASLTLTDVNDEAQTFSVMLIAHTQEKITLAGKPVGARVNVEVDMVGKYVERAVLAALGGSGGQPAEGIAKIIERVVQKAVADAAQK
ncbi:riboflavin synthase [Rhizoctonia solani AG-1 IA]|uniref:Riboflavin synthase n=1 Tax=Thanatephorus cucumeris (strain AG1-IA) TaxID=983506 RepID=L8WU08_THACA|nr:riboflavin synthase [Rhizoctonia solani AG-1 IA]